MLTKSYIKRLIELGAQLEDVAKDAKWPPNLVAVRGAIAHIAGYISAASDGVAPSVAPKEGGVEAPRKHRGPRTFKPRNRGWKCTDCDHAFQSNLRKWDVACPECKSVHVEEIEKD